jgi:hypothetical protein
VSCLPKLLSESQLTTTTFLGTLLMCLSVKKMWLARSDCYRTPPLDKICPRLAFSPNYRVGWRGKIAIGYHHLQKFCPRLASSPNYRVGWRGPSAFGHHMRQPTFVQGWRPRQTIFKAPYDYLPVNSLILKDTAVESNANSSMLISTPAIGSLS